MSAENWLFVLNPRAGRRRKLDIAALLAELAPPNLAYSLKTWGDASSLNEIVSEMQSGRYTHIVAAGGDGTVNRVAQEALSLRATLGILPLGSGNGLARSLGISVDPRQAFRQLLERNVKVIDAGTVNDRLFLCTAGVGFDAHIGGLFAQTESRGLRRYIALVMRELMKYKAQKYDLSIDGIKQSSKAFLVTIANAGQYGNNFYIAPQATLTDGLLHAVVLRPFHAVQSPALLMKMLTRRAHLSQSISTFAAREVVITRDVPGVMHCDGEPFLEGRELVFRIRPAALRVLAGPVFKGG